MGWFDPPDDGKDHDSKEEPPLGSDTWAAVDELTEKYDTDPEAYQDWSDTIDAYNDEHPDEEL